MKLFKLTAVGIAAALVLAGCSSDADTPASSAAPTSATADSAAAGTAVTSSAAGTEATGGQTGGPKVEAKTIALLYQLKAAEISVRGSTNLQEAATALGWTFLENDPAGDPQKAVSGLTNFVTQKVDGILTAAWESQVLRQPLLAAKDASIPAINVWGGVAETDLFASRMSPDETKFGETGAAEFLKLLKSGDKVGSLNSSQFTFGKARDDAFAAAAATAGVTIAADHQTDYTNPQADTVKAVNDMISANPDLAGIWSDSSLQVPGIVQVLKEKNLCGKVKVVGFYGDIQNLAAVRDGCVDIIVDVPLQAQAWAVMDALAGHFANGTELPQGLPTTYPFDVNQIQVVTKANLPSDPNAYFDIEQDYKKYFTDRWAQGIYGPPAS